MTLEELTRHAVDVLPREGLEQKLKLGRPLRVKLGVDPTSPDVHIGFAYVLDRLADFQRAGHTIVLIVGDYTARIGDPSGRSKERPVLPDEELDANAAYFAEQAFRILDRERTEVRFNGEWLGEALVRRHRAARADDDGGPAARARRLREAGSPSTSRSRSPSSSTRSCRPTTRSRSRPTSRSAAPTSCSTCSPGRDVMPQYGLEPQVVVTFPLLVGTDGELKMSKSRGNYIGITEPPEEMFGKTMSIPDAALPEWWEMLVGGEPPGRADGLEARAGAADHRPLAR